jgi:hypothetical protein
MSITQMQNELNLNLFCETSCCKVLLVCRQDYLYTGCVQYMYMYESAAAKFKPYISDPIQKYSPNYVYNNVMTVYKEEVYFE